MKVVAVYKTILLKIKTRINIEKNFYVKPYQIFHIT